jgi:hypothetical protein
MAKFITAALIVLFSVGVANAQQPAKVDQQSKVDQPSKSTKVVKLTKQELASITAGAKKWPPGQFPSGNPAQAPGNSNPQDH